MPAHWVKELSTANQPWSKWRVIEAHRSGRFAIHALAKLACVRANQVRIWVEPPGWQPMQFTCTNCGKFQSTTAKQRAAGDVRCQCGTSWREGFEP